MNRCYSAGLTSKDNVKKYGPPDKTWRIGVAQAEPDRVDTGSNGTFFDFSARDCLKPTSPTSEQGKYRPMATIRKIVYNAQGMSDEFSVDVDILPLLTHQKVAPDLNCLHGR